MKHKDRHQSILMIEKKTSTYNFPRRKRSAQRLESITGRVFSAEKQMGEINHCILRTCPSLRRAKYKLRKSHPFLYIYVDVEDWQNISSTIQEYNLIWKLCGSEDQRQTDRQTTALCGYPLVKLEIETQDICMCLSNIWGMIEHYGEKIGSGVFRHSANFTCSAFSA